MAYRGKGLVWKDRPSMSRGCSGGQRLGMTMPLSVLAVKYCVLTVVYHMVQIHYYLYCDSNDWLFVEESCVKGLNHFWMLGSDSFIMRFLDPLGLP